jgi:hypothetical protein
MAAAPSLHVCIFSLEFDANQAVKRREPKTEASLLGFQSNTLLRSAREVINGSAAYDRKWRCQRDSGDRHRPAGKRRDQPGSLRSWRPPLNRPGRPPGQRVAVTEDRAFRWSIRTSLGNGARHAEIIPFSPQACHLFVICIRHARGRQATPARAGGRPDGEEPRKRHLERLSSRIITRHTGSWT